MNRRLWFSLWTSALVLVSVFASFPTRAQTDPSAPVLDGAISFSGRRNIPNLSLLGARKERADEEEATHEGRGYWKARREWEMQESAELPAAPILRSVSEAIYRERLRYRSQDGGPQPLNATLAAAGWKSLGPTTDAGRVRDYAFTRDGSKLYAATANGGIWLLTRQGGAGSDYGNPVNLTDDLPLLTFGAVAVAPSNPSIVYAATGEQSPLSGSQVTGMGTLRSTDGGSTWSFNTSSVTGGWFDVVPSQYSYDLDVHPSNPDDVLLGTANGIFRSTDGGRTWVNRLPSTGASSTSSLELRRQGVNLARSPANPNVVWAGLWGGLGRSLDGGETWQVLFEDIAQQVGYAGLPIRSLVAIAPSNPNRLYWLVAGYESGRGYSQVGLFRSDNGGQNWGTALGPPSGQAYPLIAGSQGWTFLGMAVDPTNADRVIAGGLDTWRSEDAGLSWTQISQWTLPERHPQFCHADVDVIAFEPGLGNFWMGTDGGLFRSTNGGRSFIWKNDGVVARMFSSLAQHPTDPYRLYAGTQDNGTMKLSGDSTAAWKKIFYGDGYDCAVNYQNPNIVYATNFNGYTSRADDGGESEDSFRLTTCPPEAQTDEQCSVPPVTSFRSRLAMDPVDPRILYTMTDRIYRTSNGAATASDWQPVFAEYFCSDGISTQPCPNAQKNYASCSSISINPRDRNRVAFGTAAGYLITTVDGFQTASLLNIGSEINAIAWDPTDPNAYYVGLESATEVISGQGRHVIWRIAALDKEQKTAAPASTGIGVPVTYAGGSFSYFAPVDSLAVSPSDANLMFAGTKYGIFRSTNKGQAWSRFGDDFPATWVSSLLFSPDGSKLRAATWGRGMWEINPLGGSTGPTSPPTADFVFSPASPKPGQSVTFSDRSQGGASSWSWSFGDGTSSSLQNPTKVWASPGPYAVTLSAGNAAGTRSVTKTVTVTYGSTGTGSTYTYLLPIVLTSSGAGGAFFTSELTLTNRSGKTLNLTFRAKGSFDASSTYSLPPGQQIHPDIFGFLQSSTGMAIPSGNKTASLRVEVAGADNLVQFGAQVRVTTPATGSLRSQGVIGRFGLAFPATPLGRGAINEAFVFGLQQTSSAGAPGTRSNLACVNAGAGSGGSIRLEVTYRDGDTGVPSPSKDTFDLAAFQWDQRSQPLAARGMRYGYADVKRVSGNDQFVCYGVLNDNLNGDGAFVPMVKNDVPSRTSAAMVPVVLEAAGYTSEMTFANRTARSISGLFALLPSADPVPDWGYFDLPAGAQFTIPNIIGELRDIGFNAPAGTVGSVFVQFLDGEFRVEQSDTQAEIPTSDGFIGVRTTTSRAGGQLGLAYGYTPLGEGADTEAWVYGLQQTGIRGQEGGTRSNLAVVHSLGGNVEDLRLEVTYFAADGRELGKEPQCAPCTLAPGQWKQFNTPLSGFGASQGYARIRRVSGSDQFLAYGVLNDQGNDDGSYVPMNVP
ncbi:MAG: PKD domain-containing protein [Holophagales bacterium]|nr:PKD domain-containing protein [Holophagales bacterium]